MSYKMCCNVLFYFHLFHQWLLFCPSQISNTVKGSSELIVLNSFNPSACTIKLF